MEFMMIIDWKIYKYFVLIVMLRYQLIVVKI